MAGADRVSYGWTLSRSAQTANLLPGNNNIAYSFILVKREGRLDGKDLYFNSGRVI